MFSIALATHDALARAALGPVFMPGVWRARCKPWLLFVFSVLKMYQSIKSTSRVAMHATAPSRSHGLAPFGLEDHKHNLSLAVKLPVHANA